MSHEPTNAELRSATRLLLKGLNREEVSVKSFLQILSQRFPKADIKARKTFIKDTLILAIEEMDEQEERLRQQHVKKETPSDYEDSDDSGEEGGLGQGQEKPRKANAFLKPKQISPALQKLLKTPGPIARTEVVKLMWVRIKEKGLQNPKDGREILLDKEMVECFGRKKFTMFSMNKFISAHIYTDEPEPKVKKEKKMKKEKERKSEDKKVKSKSKTSSKASGQSASPVKGKKTRKKVEAGLQPKHILSPSLAFVCNTDALARPQIVTALWVYIKAKNLQDPNDKRSIICDEALGIVMGGEKVVTMFTMHKFIAPHLLGLAPK